MAQTLLIGLGGTGSRTVNNVVKKLHANGMSVNDGNICCAVLDTNKADVELIERSNTGVPIVATSKNQLVEDYFKDYNHKHIADWAPQSPLFMKESMLTGASEMRVKSRIAFMDCVESGMIDEIDRFINQVLTLNRDSKISVMLVSSLSGGTGSGMFIQVALWLRQRLAGAEIVMRGIFLLPDVFVSTLDDIKNSRAKTIRHYANAYAAIRELNAISKIRNNGTVDISQDIALDGLFSSKEGSLGKPVFDFAFFIDDKDENGVSLGSIRDYELAAADLIYMQMYAPMTNTMYSEEDNLFLEASKSVEPLYGSCGTAYAIYPVEDVLEYCKLRALQESLTSGWRRIDDEILALEAESQQRKKEGYTGSTTVDVNSKYIEIFERETKQREGGIRDSFFASIADDVWNYTKGNVVNGELQYTKTDKVADFIAGITAAHINTIVYSQAYNPSKYKIDQKTFVEAEHTVKDLIKKVGTDIKNFEAILRNFDRALEKHVDDIVSAIMPFNMTENMESSANTVLSLFTKRIDGQIVFVHPVSARYMLLKLINELKKTRELLKPMEAKAKTLSDHDAKFDNTATKDSESTAIAYLESKKWYQREEGFTNDFEAIYAAHINTKVSYCEKYLKESLQEKAFKKLEDRLSELLRKVEILFKDLKEARKTVAQMLEKVATSANRGNKNLVVYARPEHKEEVYQSLNIDLNGGRGINKSVITVLYGSLCAQKRPTFENNKKYLDMSIVDTFIADTKEIFGQSITENPENKKKVYLSIYQAICAESTYGLADKYSTVAMQRQRSNFISCVNTLKRMAAPLLRYNKEAVDEKYGTRQMMEKATWGFNPRIVQEFDGLGTLLGANPDTLQSDAYPANELYCYRAVYLLRADLIPKFNETTIGGYFESYKATIDEMLEMQKGAFGDQALVQTPHLDKRWHSILPYITSRMENAGAVSFYRGFWLAVAYGSLAVDKEGNFCVNKEINTGFKTKFRKAVPVAAQNGKPVPKRDVVGLIEALDLDASFTGFEIPALEERFRSELEDISTYEATAVLKGLKTTKADLNPIDMIVRYNRSAGSEVKALGALIGALEDIAYDMAQNYQDSSRSEKSITVAQYKILRKIYDSAALTKDKADVFAGWLQMFEELGVKPETTEETNE